MPGDFLFLLALAKIRHTLCFSLYSTGQPCIKMIHYCLPFHSTKHHMLKHGVGMMVPFGGASVISMTLLHTWTLQFLKWSKTGRLPISFIYTSNVPEKKEQLIFEFLSNVVGRKFNFNGFFLFSFSFMNVVFFSDENNFPRIKMSYNKEVSAA